MSLHAAAVSAAQASRVSWAAITAERWLLRLSTRQSVCSAVVKRFDQKETCRPPRGDRLTQLQDATHGEDHGAFRFTF